MTTTDRPRLLILSKYFSYGFGGTPEAVLLLARSLDRAGVSVDVRAHDRFIRDAGGLQDLPPREVPAAARPVPRLGGYSGLIVSGAWIFEALPLALAARWAGIPVIYQTKGQLCRVEFTRLRDLRRLAYLLAIEIWVLILATRIQFTSRLEREASLLPGWLKRRKGFTLPEPLDGARLGHIVRPQRAPEGTLRLGFIAQISPRKGLREFVEGLMAWSGAHPDRSVELVVAGTAVGASEAYLDAIRALADAGPRNVRIRFLGQISGAERMKFYAGTDVVVVASHFESFCLAVPEALWYGCAVLAAPRLGVLEFLPPDTPLLKLPSLGKEDIGNALTILSAGEGPAGRQPRPHAAIEALSPDKVARGLLADMTKRI